MTVSPSLPTAPRTSQEARLFELITTSRDERVRSEGERAEAEARSILREARRAANERVRRALRDSRDRHQSALEAARARISTELRLGLAQSARRWLDAAWPRLIEALESRWLDPGARRRWLDTVIERARDTLPPGSSWTVEHPSGLDPAELAGIACRMRPDASLACGIRISADGVVVDGTRDGLLSNREECEGRLLAELLELRQHGGESGCAKRSSAH